MFTLQLPPKILSKNLFYVAGGAVRVQSQLSKIVSEVAQRLAPLVLPSVGYCGVFKFGATTRNGQFQVQLYMYVVHEKIVSPYNRMKCYTFFIAINWNKIIRSKYARNV